MKLVDQVEVVDQVIQVLLQVDPVEQEIHLLQVRLQHPFKDMLAEQEKITMQVAAVVVAALRQ